MKPFTVAMWCVCGLAWVGFWYLFASLLYFILTLK